MVHRSAKTNKSTAKRSRRVSEQQAPHASLGSPNFYDALYQLDVLFDAVASDPEDDHAAYQYHVFPTRVSHPTTPNIDETWVKPMVRDGAMAVQSTKAINGKTLLDKVKSAVAAPLDSSVLERPPTPELQTVVQAIEFSDEPDLIVGSVARRRVRA